MLLAKFNTKLVLNPHRGVKRYMHQYLNPIIIITGLNLNRQTLLPGTITNE